MSEFDDDFNQHDSDPLANVKEFADILFEATKEMLNPTPSISFGRFPSLSALTKGCRPNELTILSGPTGAGKTTFIANLSADLIEQKIPHYVASVEVGPHDFVRRVMSALSGKNYFEHRVYKQHEILEFLDQFENIFVGHNHVCSLFENRFTVEALLAEMKAAHEKHGVKYAVVDNLNFFLDPVASNNTIAELDRVIHELVIFTKQVPLHFVLVMHPRKTDDERVSSTYDLKGSSTAAQEASNILFINKPHPDLASEFPAINGKYDRELKFAKIRKYGRSLDKRLILRSDYDGLKYFESKVYEHNYLTNRFEETEV